MKNDVTEVYFAEKEQLTSAARSYPQTFVRPRFTAKHYINDQ